MQATMRLEGVDAAPAVATKAAPVARARAAVPPAAEACAPRLPFGLAVGVTGHRVAAAGRETIEAAAPRVDAVLAELAAAATVVHARDAAYFCDAPPVLRLISPLADGTDQLTAALALERGYGLETILPFAHADYCDDFTDQIDCDRYLGLLDRAISRLDLPGDRAQALDAYVAAGRAVVAHADVIITLWNGEPARGRGGTGEIVEHALRRGLPVIHVPIDPDKPTRILWAGFDDPPLDIVDFCDAPVREFDARNAETLVAALLAPPIEPAERALIGEFHRERERRFRPRIEYPLLLAALGVKPFRRSVLRVQPYAETVTSEWRAFHAGCAEATHQVSGGFMALEEAYRWSDKLAEHYAMAYRSGHVLNYLLAALAVLLALTGLIAPQAKFWLVAAELGVILTLITNTRVGQRRGWHRRWLDYRHLAEQLRPMRSMKLCALARPAAARSSGRGARRWIDWYAAGYWRQMGCPNGILDAPTLTRLSTLIVEEELRPQVAYHRANSGRMHHLEHRLHMITNTLFALTIFSLVVFLFGYVFDHERFAEGGKLLAVVTAGLPALGAALHGIREQGEFVRTSHRSAATASALEKVAGDLAVQPMALPRAKSLVEEAARVMLADVGEWRMSYEMRKLAIPA